MSKFKMNKVFILLILSISLIFIYYFFNNQNINIENYNLKTDNQIKTIDNKVNRDVEIVYEIEKKEINHKKIQKYKIVFEQQFFDNFIIKFISLKELNLSKRYSINSSILNIKLTYKDRIFNKKLILEPSFLNHKDDIKVIVEDKNKTFFEFETNFLNFFEPKLKYDVYLSIYDKKIYIDSVKILEDVDFINDIMKVKIGDINFSIEINGSNIPKTLNLKGK